MKRTLISIIGLAIFIHCLKKWRESSRQSEYERHFDLRDYGTLGNHWNRI
jgi:hypothetical protein